MVVLSTTDVDESGRGALGGAAHLVVYVGSMG